MIADNQNHCYDSSKTSKFRSFLHLVRLPNVFTAMADAAMGVLFVRQIDNHADWLLLTAILVVSGLIYAAGVVLNDVFDVEIDRCERPERPLPSGQIPIGTAQTISKLFFLVALLVSVGISIFVGNYRFFIVASILVGCVVLYDAWLKQTLAGPIAMGLCRMLNVLLGMSAIAVSPRSEHLVVAGGIGLYVVGITWFAKNENQRSNRIHLMMATSVIAAGITLIGSLPYWSNRLIGGITLFPGKWYFLVAVLGLTIIWRCLWAIIEPAPLYVRRAVAQSILSIVMLDAVVCFAVRGIGWAIFILLFLVPALAIRHWSTIT